jgi:hypothetical protein
MGNKNSKKIKDLKPQYFDVQEVVKNMDEMKKSADVVNKNKTSIIQEMKRLIDNEKKILMEFESGKYKIVTS